MLLCNNSNSFIQLQFLVTKYMNTYARMPFSATQRKTGRFPFRIAGEVENAQHI